MGVGPFHSHISAGARNRCGGGWESEKCHCQNFQRIGMEEAKGRARVSEKGREREERISAFLTGPFFRPRRTLDTISSVSVGTR